MATLSSTLAWRIPWTEEPGGLQSRGPHRVRCDQAARVARGRHLSTFSACDNSETATGAPVVQTWSLGRSGFASCLASSSRPAHDGRSVASMARAMVDAAALALALASQESAPRLVLATAGQGASQARGGPNPGLVRVGASLLLREGRRLVRGEPKFKVGIPSLVSSRPAPALGALGPWRDGEQGWRPGALGPWRDGQQGWRPGVGVGLCLFCRGYFVAAVGIHLESPRWAPAPSSRARGPPLTA